jgi:hypothetical protein
VTIGVQPTTTELHLLGASTCIRMLGEAESKTKKHGADCRRQWRNVHLAIDAGTLEIQAVKVTNDATGDAPILPCLLDQIPANESIFGEPGPCGDRVIIRKRKKITAGSKIRCRSANDLPLWRIVLYQDIGKET